MKKDDAYELLIKEYLSKCTECGCDGCIAEFYYIEHNLRTDRYLQDNCPNKIKKKYFKQA